MTEVYVCCFCCCLLEPSESSQDSADVTQAASGETTLSTPQQQQHSTLTILLKQNLHPSPPEPDTSNQEPGSSLVHEGLRIAQQYGMEDFADELIKSMNGSDSEVDEQAEWDREVEKDMIQQKFNPQEQAS